MSDLQSVATPPVPVPAHAAAESAAFVWPMPYFFHRVPDQAGGHSRRCVVEENGGTSLSGDLMSFEPARGQIVLRLPGQIGERELSLDHIRMIKLASPLTLVRDAAVINKIGASSVQIAEDLPFSAEMKDGSRISGRTRGFVKKREGLYLFQLQDDPRLVTGCFIPAAQLKHLQIGALLGNALAANEAVNSKSLASALDKQARLRGERLGGYLADRAIVTAADLEQALHNQHNLPNVKLGEVLVSEKLISPEQLSEALATQHQNRERRLGDILVEMGAVSIRTIQKALSDKLGIPFVNIREFMVDPAILRMLPVAVAVRQQVLPLLRLDDTLVVAVENPLAGDILHDVQFATGMTVVPVIAEPGDLRIRIALEYSTLDASHQGAHHTTPATEHESQHDADAALALQLELEAPSAARETDKEARVTDNALVRLVNKIILDAHSRGASDIHIESNSGKSATRIRFRRDGDLEDYLELQPAYRHALVSRIKIMAGLDISEHRHAQDGKINFGKFGSVPIELRVAIVPTANNLEDVVLRLLGGVEPLALDQLGLSVRDLSELKSMVNRSYGLILVCGPTGSGKTTTLHSVLHHINRPDLKIWTAEDPVEISQPGLRQVQINARIGWTFAAAMRAFLRADPDVIMVGEMRDAETTKIGIEASLTGHLVFSTLHTNSAAESIVRLLDLGMDPFNFADALLGVLSQRLARKLCPHCKKAHIAGDAELANLTQEYCAGTRLDSATVLLRWRQQYGAHGALTLHEAVGCERCSGGYRGRVGVYELLTSSAALKALVRSRGSIPQLVESAQAGGMNLLRQDAIEKVLRGVLDLPSARVAST